MRRLHRHQHQRGLTLIEILVALLIAAFVSITFMASIIFMFKQNAANRNHFYALQVANKYISMISAADYQRLGDPNVDTDAFEAQFNYEEDDPLDVKTDPQYEEFSETVEIWFEHKGWGFVDSSTDKVVDVVLPSNQEPWEANEWAGQYMTITRGTGSGQVVRIVSNDSDSATVTRDLTGASTTDGFIVPPDGTSRFVINNGKTVIVTVSWGDGDGYRTIQREILIPRRTDG